MDDALRARCVEALHVLTIDGRTLAGAEAILFLALRTALIPRVARVAYFPPILWTLEQGYKVMARHRSFFARFLFRSDNGPFASPDP